MRSLWIVMRGSKRNSVFDDSRLRVPRAHGRAEFLRNPHPATVQAGAKRPIEAGQASYWDVR